MINLTYVFNLKTMLPNRIVLTVVLLVYHTRTTSPLWRPYYDRYPLTIPDRLRYYRLAYVIQNYVLSVILISFFVYHTNVPGYHNHLYNPVTSTSKAACVWSHLRVVESPCKPDQIALGVIFQLVVSKFSDVGKSNNLLGRKTTRMCLEANWTLFNVNQPKTKTMTMPTP